MTRVEDSDQDGQVGGHGTHPPPTSTLNVHLHVEHFFWDSNCRLAESITKAKKDPHGIGWEGKRREAIRLKPAPERGQKRRQMTQLETCPGSERFKPHIWHASPGFRHWEDESP